jgi:hypothetical protein
VLRLAAATAAVVAIFVGAMYVRYSGDVRPREAEPWASWIDGSQPVPEPVDLVYDASLVASANVAPEEACRPVFTWRSEGIITEPIAQTLQEIRLLNTCNRPDPSTARATRSTWDTAHAILQARGVNITKTCEPRCAPDDHTKAWIVEIRGTFVPPDYVYGGVMVPDSAPTDASPGTPIAGTWYSIIPE